MDFKTFYRGLEAEKFKMFLKAENYYLYDNEIIQVAEILNTKEINTTLDIREIKISKEVGESVIKHVLCVLKLSLQEYVFSNTTFVLHRCGTPGNWKDFEYLCIGKNMEPVIAAVYLSKDLIYVSLLIDGSIRHTRFEDDDIFTNLYSVLCENNVLEVVYNDRKLERPLFLMGLLIHFYKCKATDSTGLLKAYLNINKVTVNELVCEERLRCNKDVLEALNYKSLLEIFTITTVQGSRLLEKIFKNPLRNRDEIVKRHHLVSEFHNINTDFLKGFPDLKKTSRIIENGNPDLDLYLKLRNTIQKIPNILSCLSHGSKSSEFAPNMVEVDFIAPITDIYEGFTPLLSEISHVILEDGDSVVVNPTLNLKLKDLHSEKCAIKTEIANEFQRVLRINKKVKLELNNTFKLSRLDYNSFEEEFKDNRFVELSFLKTGVYFTTIKLSALGEKMALLESTIKNEERAIRQELKEFARRFIASVDVYNYLVALMDVYKAFSQKFSENWGFPMFGDKFSIKNGFHPILKRNVVKNDITIHEKKFVVVTGPNMGGKSTFLKMCGVIVLLAQVGCCVPADSCELPIFDSIFVRIGAMDYPSLNISTFLGEMMDISKITRNATARSLILIDELGRGTSALDGLCIATAVKEFLLQKKCITLFATHFPQLCDEETLNKQVGVSDGMLNYLVMDGVCDVSFGLNVAEFVGFPDAVLQNARKYMEIP